MEKSIPNGTEQPSGNSMEGHNDLCEATDRWWTVPKGSLVSKWITRWRSVISYNLRGHLMAKFLPLVMSYPITR